MGARNSAMLSSVLCSPRAQHPGALRRSRIWKVVLPSAPALLTLLMAGIDVGLAFGQMSALDNAAKAGVRYAARLPSHVQGIIGEVKQSLPRSGAGVEVRSAVHCECPGSGTIVACVGSARSCGGEAADAFRTVTVIVSMPYASPLPTSALIRTTALSRSATFRIR